MIGQADRWSWLLSQFCFYHDNSKDVDQFDDDDDKDNVLTSCWELGTLAKRLDNLDGVLGWPTKPFLKIIMTLKNINIRVILPLVFVINIVSIN